MRYLFFMAAVLSLVLALLPLVADWFETENPTKKSKRFIAYRTRHSYDLYPFLRSRVVLCLSQRHMDRARVPATTWYIKLSVVCRSSVNLLGISHGYRRCCCRDYYCGFRGKTGRDKLTISLHIIPHVISIPPFYTWHTLLYNVLQPP